MILSIYREKSHTVSEIADRMRSALGSGWATNLPVPVNGSNIYNREEEICIQVLQRHGMVGGPRTLESVLGETVVKEMLVMWDAGVRALIDIAHVINEAKDIERWVDATDGVVTVRDVHEVLVRAGRTSG
jgi:hypothetical protein